MVLGALIANHTLPAVHAMASRRVPVETFPRKIGEWTAGKDQRVDPSVLQRLSTANIVDRNYRNPAGQDIDLTLVTASNGGDLHNPKICFPAQGWRLGDEKVIHIGGRSANYMIASQNGAQFEVIYWLTGSSVRRSAFSEKLVRLHTRFVGLDGHVMKAVMDGDSLMVRLMAPHDPDSHRALLQFAGQIQSPIQALIARAGDA